MSPSKKSLLRKSGLVSGTFAAESKEESPKLANLDRCVGINAGISTYAHDNAPNTTASVRSRTSLKQTKEILIQKYKLRVNWTDSYKLVGIIPGIFLKYDGVGGRAFSEDPAPYLFGGVHLANSKSSCVDILDIKPPAIHETAVILTVLVNDNRPAIHTASVLLTGFILVLSVVCAAAAAYEFSNNRIASHRRRFGYNLLGRI